MDHLFIPLKTKYFEQFKNGSKHWEYRQYGPRWNERTCRVGRRVTLSRGYGKRDRLRGKVLAFHTEHMDTPSWIDCYGKPGLAACICIEVSH